MASTTNKTSGKPVEYHLRLIVSADSVDATLRITPGFAPDEMNAEAIYRYLDTKGVRRASISADAVDRILDLAAEAQTSEIDDPVEETIASGEPPEHGRDATISLEPDLAAAFEEINERQRLFELRRRQGFTEPEAGADVDEASNADGEEAIDFRAKSAFVIVPSGRTLGRFEPALPGKDGEDVFGGAIPAKGGKSLAIQLAAGVRRGSGDTLVATNAGRLIFNDREIRVERRLEIRGAVDYSTGHVDFPGDVKIARGIKDRFRVEAAGDVEIDDLVEAADIACRGSLKIDGGMTGRDKGTIHAGRDLTANYLDCVSGVVGVRLVIAREINNCAFSVEGKVESPSAVLLGGTLRAAHRVELSQIGGRGGVRSDLYLGVVDALEEKLVSLSGTLRTVHAMRAKSTSELETLESNIAKLT
ncbi:MAG: FapA family protein, partial [Planctomycetota bacterium]